MKAILIAAILTGCTTSMVNPNPRADFDQDYYECQKDAAPVTEQPRRYQMEQMCMKTKGWRPA